MLPHCQAATQPCVTANPHGFQYYITKVLRTLTKTTVVAVYMTYYIIVHYLLHYIF